MTDLGGGTVVVMTKAPEAGSVKTRLQPLLGPAGCAELQTLLIEGVVALTAEAGYRTVVAVTPDTAVPATRALAPHPAIVIPQRGSHLGQRMAGAVEQALADGAAKVVVVGTDLPTLTGATLDAAFQALDTADVVVGPALDGGYYLIGMRRALPELFALDPTLWGSPRVLDATLRLAATHGLTVHALEPARDLDTPEDAAVLSTDPRVAAPVRHLLSTTRVAS